MADNYNEDDLIRGINENMSFVKNTPIEAADKCAGSIRSTLEYAVKLFWLKKYDKKPVWVKGYIESFDLHKAISDERFSQHFSKMTLSYMHTIRQTCNGVLHDNDPLTLDEAKDLLVMLEKCVKAIENAIPMEILVSPIKELSVMGTVATNEEENLIGITEESPTQPKDNILFTAKTEKLLDDFKSYLIRCGYAEYTPSGLPSTAYDYVGRIKKILEWESMTLSELNQNIDKLCHEYDIGGIKQELGDNSHRAVINALKRYREYLSAPTYSTPNLSAHSPETTKTYDSNSEQTVFWRMLQEALNNNGNPFTISTRAQYGTVNRKSPNSNLCLGFDFLLQKGFFRIGIYIQDDTVTPCFDRLLQQKDEIESLLGFAPIWTTQGAKNPNTRRIETRLSFIAYDREDYERLIDEALPVFMQYIKVFSKYLPEAFENKQTYGGQNTMSASVIIGNSLKRNLSNGYGGSAQPIYDECCDRFDWDRSQRYLFGKQQILYAEGATPEGYSPWFLVHSNLTETKGGNWSNKILQDTIEEAWEKPQYGLYHDETTRVTFAKTKSFGYVFIGMYKPIKVDEKILSNGNKVWVKTYQRIADTYPIVE